MFWLQKSGMGYPQSLATRFQFDEPDPQNVFRDAATTAVPENKHNASARIVVVRDARSNSLVLRFSPAPCSAVCRMCRGSTFDQRSIAIVRPFDAAACSRLFMVMVSTPFLNFASMLSRSASAGRFRTRWKLP